MKRIKEKIKKEIKIEFGEVEGCCTLAGEVFHRLAAEVDLEESCERFQGVVRDEDGDEYNHEWMLYEGTLLDITREQFDFAIEYDGEQTDWHGNFSQTEQAEINKIYNAVKEGFLEGTLIRAFKE